MALHLVIGCSPQFGFNGLKVMVDALEFAGSPAEGISGPTRMPLRDDTGWCAEQDDAVELAGATDHS